MLRSVDFVSTAVSEEHIATIIRVTRIDEVGTALAVHNNRSMLQRNATDSVAPSSSILVTLMMTIFSTKMSVFIKATRC
jgi:hypothetical protein